MMRALLVLLAALGTFGLCARVWAEPMPAREADKVACAVVDRLVEMGNLLTDEYFHSGEFDKAVLAIERVIALGATDYEHYANAAWLLWSSGKTEEALDSYKRMIEANPDNPRAYFEVGVFYYRLQNYAEAEHWLAKAVELGLSSPFRHLYGHVLVKLGRNADALAFWRAVLADEPDSAVAKTQIEGLTRPRPPSAPEPAPTP